MLIIYEKSIIKISDPPYFKTSSKDNNFELPAAILHPLISPANPCLLYPHVNTLILYSFIVNNFQLFLTAEIYIRGRYFKSIFSYPSFKLKL